MGGGHAHAQLNKIRSRHMHNTIYKTQLPNSQALINNPYFVDTVDIELVPVYGARVRMQLLLWTNIDAMLDFLSGGDGWQNHYYTKNLIDTSKSDGKIYHAMKFSIGQVTKYGYIFHTPYTIPDWKLPILGWSVNEANVKEILY